MQADIKKFAASVKVDIAEIIDVLQTPTSLNHTSFKELSSSQQMLWPHHGAMNHNLAQIGYRKLASKAKMEKCQKVELSFKGVLRP